MKFTRTILSILFLSHPAFAQLPGGQANYKHLDTEEITHTFGTETYHLGDITGDGLEEVGHIFDPTNGPLFMLVPTADATVVAVLNMNSVDDVVFPTGDLDGDGRDDFGMWSSGSQLISFFRFELGANSGIGNEIALIGTIGDTELATSKVFGTTARIGTSQSGNPVLATQTRLNGTTEVTPYELEIDSVTKQIVNVDVLTVCSPNLFFQGDLSTFGSRIVGLGDDNPLDGLKFALSSPDCITLQTTNGGRGMVATYNSMTGMSNTLYFIADGAGGSNLPNDMLGYGTHLESQISSDGVVSIYIGTDDLSSSSGDRIYRYKSGDPVPVDFVDLSLLGFPAYMGEGRNRLVSSGHWTLDLEEDLAVCVAAPTAVRSASTETPGTLIYSGVHPDRLPSGVVANERELVREVAFDSLQTVSSACIADRGSAELWIGLPDYGLGIGLGRMHVECLDPFVHPSTLVVDTSSPVDVDFNVQFPAQNSGHDYRVLVSTESRPYLDVLGLTVPIPGTGPYFALSLAGQLNSTLFPGFAGQLDSTGAATATFAATQVNGLGAFSGSQFFLCVIVLDAIGIPSETSTRVTLTFLP